MKELYVLKCVSNAEEYIKIKGKVADIRLPIIKSEIQHLDEKKVQFDISEEGGLEIPDVICYEGIFLFSNRLKQVVDLGRNYVFWKEADVRNERFGIHETFWIAVPPRIDCLDIDGSEFDVDISELTSQWNFEDGLVPMLGVKKIVIQEKLIGRFEIFKLLGVLDNNIYVKKELYEIISSQNFEGIEWIKL